MNDPYPPELADWEKRLIDGEVTPEEQQRLDAEAAEEAARREAWPLLYDGSATVDLAQVWDRLRDAEHGDEHGLDLVDALAEEAGGVAKRLAAGVRSLTARGDGYVHVATEIDYREGRIHLACWSLRGHWSQRAWHVEVLLQVGHDEHGKLFLAPYLGTTMAVRSKNGGDTTVFRDPARGPIGQVVARWYVAWKGRSGIREMMGIDQPSASITLDQFLALRSPE